MDKYLELTCFIYSIKKANKLPSCEIILGDMPNNLLHDLYEKAKKPQSYLAIFLKKFKAYRILKYIILINKIEKYFHLIMLINFKEMK